MGLLFEMYMAVCATAKGRRKSIAPIRVGNSLIQRKKLSDITELNEDLIVSFSNGFIYSEDN